ncbi:hypothetical protein D3C85_1444190 [compost metagenome]
MASPIEDQRRELLQRVRNLRPAGRTVADWHRLWQLVFVEAEVGRVATCDDRKLGQRDRCCLRVVWRVSGHSPNPPGWLNVFPCFAV